MGDQLREKFRDSISTIDESGQRNFIFPKKPKGKLYKYRTYGSWFLLAILLTSPFPVSANSFQVAPASEDLKITPLLLPQ